MIVVTLEGGFVTSVVTHDQELLDQDIDVLVVDYDAEDGDTNIVQPDGKVEKASISWEHIDRQDIEIK